MTHFGEALQNVVRVLQRRRHALGRFVAGVTEHDALVAGPFVFLGGRVDALGDVRGLAVQIIDVAGLLPVEALLLVADVLHRSADLRLQRGDDFFGEGLVFGFGSARLSGPHLARDDDAVGGDHGFAGHARLGIGLDEGVHDGIGDAVGDLVRVPFGHAFGSEDVIASRHADSPGPREIKAPS